LRGILNRGFAPQFFQFVRDTVENVGLLYVRQSGERIPSPLLCFLNAPVYHVDR
jgi:hypothetical protein